MSNTPLSKKKGFTIQPKASGHDGGTSYGLIYVRPRPKPRPQPPPEEPQIETISQIVDVLNDDQRSVASAQYFVTTPDNVSLASERTEHTVPNQFRSVRSVSTTNDDSGNSSKNVYESQYTVASQSTASEPYYYTEDTIDASTETSDNETIEKEKALVPYEKWQQSQQCNDLYSVPQKRASFTDLPSVEPIYYAPTPYAPIFHPPRYAPPMPPMISTMMQQQRPPITMMQHQRPPMPMMQTNSPPVHPGLLFGPRGPALPWELLTSKEKKTIRKQYKRSGSLESINNSSLFTVQPPPRPMMLPPPPPQFFPRLPPPPFVFRPPPRPMSFVAPVPRSAVEHVVERSPSTDSVEKSVVEMEQQGDGSQERLAKEDEDVEAGGCLACFDKGFITVIWIIVGIVLVGLIVGLILGLTVT